MSKIDYRVSPDLAKARRVAAANHVATRSIPYDLRKQAGYGACYEVGSEPIQKVKAVLPSKESQRVAASTQSVTVSKSWLTDLLGPQEVEARYLAADAKSIGWTGRVR